MCPDKSFVVAFKLRVETYQGSGDDTALNEIELICNDEDETVINGAGGFWGEWSEKVECERGFRGFQLKQEPDQGSNSDNTAANGLKMFCGDNMELTTKNNGAWGNWSESVFCPNETVICGLRVQIELNQGPNVDDSTLNNVDFKCCSQIKAKVKNMNLH